MEYAKPIFWAVLIGFAVGAIPGFLWGLALSRLVKETYGHYFRK